MTECAICGVDINITGEFVCDNCGRKVCETCFSFAPEQDEGGLCTQCATPTPPIEQLEGIASQLTNLAMTNKQVNRSKNLQLLLFRLAEQLRGISKKLTEVTK